MDDTLELMVYYTCDGWSKVRVEDEDKYAAEVAGVAIKGREKSGTGVRSLRFIFPSDNALRKAKLDLKDAGFRFVP